MEHLEIIEIVIILGIVFVKFGVIIGTVFYVKRRNERKKQQFLYEEAQRRMARTASIDAGHQ